MSLSLVIKAQLLLAEKYVKNYMNNFGNEKLLGSNLVSWYELMQFQVDLHTM